MRTRPLPLAVLALLSVVALAGGRGTSLEEELRFGVEAARNGLWREAIFRWEKYLGKRPDDARVRNNLAVAYESLGQFDKARREYEEALRLEPDRKEIRRNYESFEELRALLRARAGARAEAKGDERRP
ncbi:MAG: tetratricopeptide repeat protein [Acidobacteriota bacterium]